MTIFELHPEELRDKAARGDITKEERARLDSHLASCPTCRFEEQARADFRQAMEVDAAMAAQIARLLAQPRAAVKPSRTHQVRVAILVAAATLGVSAVSVAAWPPVARALRSLPTLHVESTTAPSLSRPTRSADRDDPTVHASTLALEPPTPPHASDPEPPPLHETMVKEAEVPRARPKTREESPRQARPAEQKFDAATLFVDATRAERGGEGTKALEIYGELLRSFPTSSEAETARATVGQLLLDRGDPDGALSSFDAYLRAGGGRLREEAFVGRAVALERMGREPEEALAWGALLKAFPATPHAAHARSRLASIAGH